MIRAWLIIGLCVFALTSTAGCSLSSDTQRRDWAPRKIAEAPYERSDPKVWDRYFLQNRGRIGPEAAEGIVIRAIEGLDDAEAICHRLTEMGVPNSLTTESSIDPDELPRIGFRIPKSQYTQGLIDVVIGGRIMINEDGPPYLVKARNMYTGL